LFELSDKVNSRKEPMHSVSIEDYIKTIYLINQDEQVRVSGKLLAERLQISNAAVTDMARKLDEKDLITYQKYKALELTETGRLMALKLVRRHRLWELFLHQVLKMDLQQVHKEAEQLEHQTSDALISAMDRYLQHPQFDPHGDPIPGADGQLPQREQVVKLSKLPAGDYRIVRLTYSHSDLAAFYQRHQLALGMSLQLVQRFALDDSIEIKANKQTIVVSKNMADHMYCEAVS